MKKFLSLVLALVMTMSLVTISAGAKEFTDDDKITYEEAVDVISTIGVVDGDTNGAFRPTDTLTRQVRWLHCLLPAARYHQWLF